MKKYLRLIRRNKPHRRRASLRLARRAFRDERGGAVMEYAIVMGLIVVAAIGVIGCVGDKVVARWSALRDSM